jgi:hypothetical protein
VPPAIPFNATFSFKGLSAQVTGLSVETPTAEIVDMTGVNDPTGHSVQIPSGDIRGGSITVDFLNQEGGTDPQSLVGQYGLLAFQSDGYSVSRQVILENVSVDARTGQLVSGQLKFRMTDYYG